MKNEKNSKSEKWKIIIPAIFTLIGVMLGNYLTYTNSYNLFTKQKNFDNQRISYSKLIALKISLGQNIQTYLDAKTNFEFYDTRYALFTHQIQDYNNATKQSENVSIALRDVSIQNKELFEILGIVQTCYELDNELQFAIDDIFNYQVIDVTRFPTNLKSENELIQYYDKINIENKVKIKSQYVDKIDRLVKILKNRITE